MSDVNPSNQLPPPQPLNYQPPRDDLPRRKRERRRAIAGGILSFLAILWSVFVLIMSSLTPEGGTSNMPSLAIASIFILPVLAALIVTAIYQWRRHGSKAFLLGGLIGIGVAALVEGACFMITRG